MVEVHIVDTTPEHVREIAKSLRPEDRQEIEAFGFPTNKALWRSYKSSILRKTALIDGKVAAIWGVGGTPLGNGEGCPWLMTSPLVEKVSPLRFARVYQEEVLKMLEIFPHLVNYVDSQYTKAIRLLDIIGFRIGEPEPVGPKGGLFRKFEIGV